MERLGQTQVEGPIPAVIARIGKGLDSLSVGIDALEGRLRGIMSSSSPSMEEAKPATPPMDGAMLGQLNDREAAIFRLNERVEEMLKRLQV